MSQVSFAVLPLFFRSYDRTSAYHYHPPYNKTICPTPKTAWHVIRPECPTKTKALSVIRIFESVSKPC